MDISSKCGWRRLGVHLETHITKMVLNSKDSIGPFNRKGYASVIVTASPFASSAKPLRMERGREWNELRRRIPGIVVTRNPKTPLFREHLVSIIGSNFNLIFFCETADYEYPP